MLRANLRGRDHFKDPGRPGAPIAIVASRYNRRYVDAMLRAAQRELKAAGARTRVIRVPGAFEIPAVAASLASQGAVAAIVCLGVIFQGETSHAEHIGGGVTGALAEIQVRRKIPVIHGVFVFHNKEQARARCLERKYNRGTEAARTALAMTRVMRNLAD
ncbi:MAG: 6,7-dimethyl-8-ribityllumazine synthase [Verrucomicrobia bacterium]|nr:6,7-dimethyl-8-ribityllumazine synthase [Verrucomicrobiota bacterium]MDE3099825.1 6,7-dimethyl-8-ribityllumazine synthase [Verrucomicrobiota bacterium]